jgi:hypothetical protein
LRKLRRHFLLRDWRNGGGGSHVIVVTKNCTNVIMDFQRQGMPLPSPIYGTMKFVQDYFVSKMNELILLLRHIGHLPDRLHLLKATVVAPWGSSMLGITRVQCLLDQKVIVKSSDNPRTKVLLDTPPKSLMDGMAFRCTNPEVVVAILSRRKLD